MTEALILMFATIGATFALAGLFHLTYCGISRLGDYLHGRRMEKIMPKIEPDDPRSMTSYLEYMLDKMDDKSS